MDNAGDAENAEGVLFCFNVLGMLNPDHISPLSFLSFGSKPKSSLQSEHGSKTCDPLQTCFSHNQGVVWSNSTPPISPKD